MSESYSLALYALFDKHFKLDAAKIQQHLEQLLGGSASLFGRKKVQVKVQAESASGGVIDLQFNDHRLQLVAFTVPIPAIETEYPLQVAHLRPEHKEQLRQHRAHIIIYHKGGSESAVEQFIALYQTAFACNALGLVGVINPHTWMCMITSMLAQTISPAFLTSFRESPAASMGLWLGYNKYFKPDNEVWFATRGASLFQIPDFAYLGPLSEGDRALHMFGTLISYVFQTKARLAPGHTIQLPDNIYLRFGKVSEYKEFLGQDTLILERINASEINQRQP